MVFITILYVLFLMIVLLYRPSVGDRLFGWTQRERKWRNEYGSEHTFTGTVKNLLTSSSGQRAVVKIDGGPLCVVRWQGQEIKSGSRLSFSGRIGYPERPMNPGAFDEQTYMRLNHWAFTVKADQTVLLEEGSIPRLLKEAAGNPRTLPDLLFYFGSCTRDAVIQRIRRLWDEDTAGIMAAMLTGSKQYMEEEEKDLFEAAGISHILAISGLHLSILAKALTKLLEKKLSPRRSKAVCNAAVWVYTFWCGASVATVRAALMLTVSDAAKWMGRDEDKASSISFSMLVMLLIQPYYLKNAGFWMTFAALCGLDVGSVLVRRLRFIPYYARQLMASSLGVSLFTAPVSLWFFYETSLVSFLLNLWVLPMMTYVMLLAVLSLLLSLVSVPLAMGPALLVKLLLKSFLLGSTAFKSLSSLPFMTLHGRPSPVNLMLYLLLLAFCFAVLRRERIHDSAARRVVRGGAVLCLIILVFSRGHVQRVTFLSVGQGDACVLEWGHRTIVVDAGPSYTSVIKPYLSMRGITTIDVLIVSHPDQDHIRGAIQMASDEDFTIRRLILADQQVQDTPLRRKLLENIHPEQTAVSYVSGGDRIVVTQEEPFHPGRKLEMQVVGPLRQYSTTNSGSLVVRVTLGGISFLLTGDCDEEAEADMAAAGVLQPVDVLKAGHHGSKRSTSSLFLEKIKPAEAIISCGRNNRYGHPHKETIDRLNQAGVRWDCTAYAGAVSLEKWGPFSGRIKTALPSDIPDE